MKNATVTQLRKYLKSMEKEDLEEMIVDFFKEDPSIKKQISYNILGEDYGKEIVEDYRKQLWDEFYKSTSRLSIRRINGYLTSLKREVGENNKLYADLVLFCAENILNLIETFQYSEEKLGSAYYKKFMEVIRIVSVNQNAFNYLKDRINALMENDYLNETGAIESFGEEYSSIPWLSDEERTKYSYNAKFYDYLRKKTD